MKWHFSQKQVIMSMKSSPAGLAAPTRDQQTTAASSVNWKKYFKFAPITISSLGTRLSFENKQPPVPN